MADAGDRDSVTTLPTIEVVTAVYNERALLPGKLRDLADLRYPADRVRFWIVDGASTDGGAAVAAEWAAHDPRFRVIRLPRPDKAAQLNHAVQGASGQLVVVSDADARLPPDALHRVAQAFDADPALGAVGATVVPTGVHPLERVHWCVTNAIRRTESRLLGVTCLTAPCYAFRRTLVPAWPDDAVADDLYVAFRVTARGWKVACLDLGVEERRGPRTVADLLRQKRRKVDAALRELFRAAGLLGTSAAEARTLVTLRLVQLLVIPVLAAIVVITAGISAALALAGS